MSIYAIIIAPFIDIFFTTDEYKAKFNQNFDLENGYVFITSSTFFNNSILIGEGIYQVGINHPDNVDFIARSTNLGRNWEITQIKEIPTSSNYIEVDEKTDVQIKYFT